MGGRFARGRPRGQRFPDRLGLARSRIHSYDHSVGDAVIGGYVYRGPSDGLQGQYFFADFNGKIFTLDLDNTNWVATERTSQIQTNAGAIDVPTSFGEDALGNLYITDIDGDVFRLTPVVSAGVGDQLNSPIALTATDFVVV